METLKEAIELADRFGMGIIEILLILLAIYLINNKKKISEFIGLINDNLKTSKQDFELKTYNKIRLNVFREYAILHDLLSLQPLRIIIYKYVRTNGGYNVSIYDEMPNVGYEYLSKDWNNFRLGKQGEELLQDMLKQGYYHLMDIEEMKDGETKDALTLNGAKSFYSTVLKRTEDENQIMILSMSFNRPYPLGKEEILRIENQANNLKNLLFVSVIVRKDELISI